MTYSKTQPDFDLTAYAGRWVALEGEQVMGVGHTGPEALRAARHSRPKGKFVLHFAEVADSHQLTLSPLLARLRPYFAQIDQPLFLVGGAVRDSLLGIASHDLDFVAAAEGIKTAYKLGDLLGRPAYVLDKARDVGRVVLADVDTMLDIAVFRGPTLEADLYDRDFTINAMALPAAAQTESSLIDPWSGQVDLQAQVVRQVHAAALRDDPIRGLRAIRMGLKFGYTVTLETQNSARQALQKLSQTSAERVRDELLKIIQVDGAGGLAQLQQLGGLSQVLPAIARLEGVAQSAPHHEPVLAHTLSVLRELQMMLDALQNGRYPPHFDLLSPYTPQLRAHLARPVAGGLTGGLLLRLAAIFHDVGKADTQTVEEEGQIRFFGHATVGANLTEQALRDLRLSREALRHTAAIVRGHMRPLLLARETEISERAIYRFFNQLGTAGLDIILLSIADNLATYAGELGPDWPALSDLLDRLLDGYFTRYGPKTTPLPLLSGSDLQAAFDLTPGPLIGILLRQLKEAQTVGDISTRAEALALAQRLVWDKDRPEK